jgi:penicillin-binding protein 1A
VQKGSAPAPYFVEYIRQKVEERFGSSILYTGGLNIHTSIDDGLQAVAEEVVRTGLPQLEAKQTAARKGRSPLQAAVIALNPATGHILAMVGGRDFQTSQFNRSWQAYRQPGSAFKPVVYAAAIERGYSATDLLDDTPLTIHVDARKTWSPENFTRTYQGPVTLRNALAQSLNVPTVRLLSSVGVHAVIDVAHRLGIRSALKPVLSLALGSSDVTLLELTSAYAVFANQGTQLDPLAILLISDSSGRVLYTGSSAPVQALRPETAYIVTHLLRGVVERGTGWKARDLGRPVAGKTGTTNDYRDAWFIGYSPMLVAGVWVGYDDQHSLGPRATGARAALPLWIDFMRKAHEAQERAEFPVPDNILFKNIDPRSGRLSTERCRTSLREAFVPGTEPRTYCDERGIAADEAANLDEAPEEPR